MIKREERSWIIQFTLVIILITTIPYMIGFWKQGSEWAYSGFLFGVEDGNSYIAKMLSGANGAWLFKTPYSAYPQDGLLAFLPYILLGKLTSQPGQHTQLIVLFQTFRWAGCFLLVYAIYQFVGLFSDDPSQRRLGTALATIGGGIGWLYSIGLHGLWGDRFPLEFYSPEAFGFLSILGIPHLLFSRAFLLLGFVEFIQGFKSQAIRSAPYKTGIYWLLMGFFQPLDIVIAWGVSLVSLSIFPLIQWVRKTWSRIEWKEYQRFCISTIWVFLISSPWVFYSLWSSFQNDFLIAWNQQNIILSPPLQDYLLAYGLLIPTTIFGLVKVYKKNNFSGYLLLAWLILFPILAYFPSNLQRRMTEGIWVVLITFLVMGLAEMSKRPRLAYLLYSLLIVPLILIMGSIVSLWNPSPPLYRPYAEVQAFNALRRSGTAGDVVMASYNTSNALPAWVPMRVLLGHGPEGIHLNLIAPRVTEFYSASTPDEARMDLIREFSVKYVIRGPGEAALGSWDPATAPFLERIYSESGYEIYQVISR